MGSCISIYRRKKQKTDAIEPDDPAESDLERKYTDTSTMLKKSKSASKSEPGSLRKRSYAVNIGSTNPVEEFGLEYNSDDPDLSLDTNKLDRIDNLSDIDPLESNRLSYNSYTNESLADTLDKEIEEFIHL